MPRYIAFIALLLAVIPGSAQEAPKKRLLAWADVTTGYQHDSISHALAVIERLGRESGEYETYIRTDSQWITKQPFSLPARHTHDLKDFDAIFFFGVGDTLNPQQKADLMSFIHDDGRGFIGAHTGDDAFFEWPEFGKMIGGYFDDHPWNTFEAPVVVEDSSLPFMKMFPPQFTIHDEIYQHKDFSRDRVHVLARLDASKLDLANPKVHRTDRDFPVAWVKMYGTGRVFYSSFGHTVEAWDNPRVQQMYVEAIRWATRLAGDDVKP